MPLCDLCGHVALTGNVCVGCARKAPLDRFRKAVNLNLQINTVEDMIARFAIENHQVKHYAGGDRDYAHFDAPGGSLSWEEVHKLIVYCATRILALQKAQGLLKPCNGYVQFEDIRAQREWYAGRNKGYSGVVMVQLNTSLEGGFSGHGYPLDDRRVQALKKEAFLATGSYGAWAGITLSGVNNSIRIMKIGA